MECLFHATFDSIALASVQFGEIHRSIDSGQTFQNIIGPIRGGDTTIWVTQMAMDAFDPEIIYLGFKPIMKSTDGGVTFNAASPDSISGHRLLVNSVTNSQRLYVGDTKGCGSGCTYFEMHMSPDGGNTWIRLDTVPTFPFPDRLISAATVNPMDDEEIWITIGRYTSDKVYRSLDAGQTWTNMTGSLPNVPMNAIEYQVGGGTPDGAIYVASDIGVFYRDDNLGDWIHFSNNLPMVEVTDLDIDYNGGFIRASTYGRGMWESELYTTCQPLISLNPSNQKLGASYVHSASNQIFSSAVVDGVGSRVIYRSANTIQLTEGFNARAQNGALFNGVLAPCNAGGIVDPVQGESGATGNKN